MYGRLAGYEGTNPSQEGPNGSPRTRLSCHRFPANQVRLALFVLAYPSAEGRNFLRRLCLPKAIKDWPLRSVQVKLIKIGGPLVRHARRLVFQLAEVAVPREVVRSFPGRIGAYQRTPSSTRIANIIGVIRADHG